MTAENLGPAERILQTLMHTTFHLYHNRPGIVVPDPSSPLNVRWDPVTTKQEDGQIVVYKATKKSRTRLGVLQAETMQVMQSGRSVGSFRKPGLFPEAVVWVYEHIAEVWRMNNKFAAHWASYAFGKDHRDLKMSLAAFMLVQSRCGAPISEDGETFTDEDYREIGEAMMLLHLKDKSLDPKYLLRIGHLLNLPQIAEINRNLGFGNSVRRPFLGRWPKAVLKWLGHREANPRLMQGLIKAGYRTTVMRLASRVGYKPSSEGFFKILRWKQVQADDGRRTLAIGAAVSAAESWETLSEEQVCRRIVRDKPSWKRVVGLLGNQAPTRAMMAAAIEAGVFSDQDLIIQTATLEELGLLQVQSIRERHERALQQAKDLRALNIAKNVRGHELKEKLQTAADTALKKAVEAAVRGLRVYVFVDISGSMSSAISTAKEYLEKFIQGIPLDKLHVCVFNTYGTEIQIKTGSRAGVNAAFRGISAGGGTSYASGVLTLRNVRPGPDEDVLFIFVGDEADTCLFHDAVRHSGLNPRAFGLIRLGNSWYHVVSETAAQLGIPCLKIDKSIFEGDPYALPRTLQALMASTPVGMTTTTSVPRKSLVEEILATPLLQRPEWAA